MVNIFLRESLENRACMSGFYKMNIVASILFFYLALYVFFMQTTSRGLAFVILS